MRSLLWKPLKLCSPVPSEVKDVSPKHDQPAMPSLLTQLQTAREAEKFPERQSKDEAESSSARAHHAGKGLLREKATSSVISSEKKSSSQTDKPRKATRHQRKADSRKQHDAKQEFRRAMAMARGKVFTDHESLPSYETAFAFFKDMYPRYLETSAMDKLRSEEYSHLRDNGCVCLDYCGFGLFSHLQQVEQWDSASFGLSNISVNLCSHALFGAADEGTVECDIRKRIMSYLKINESDYSMVFTASRGSTFKLLADAYPFETCNRLITMYDYESESVSLMVQRAKEKGAKVSSVSFKLPSLRIVSAKLRNHLVARQRKRGSAKGLFVFPAQSRVTGAKYSYQWMSLAQRNKWHVLLDASAIGPKDMDSLGLYLFRPDFIISSFYKVFGADPSGFGCLFIKNSVIEIIRDESGAPTPGIVRIVPYPVQWSWGEPSEGDQAEKNEFDESDCMRQGLTDFEFQRENDDLTQVVASFSGPMLGFNRKALSEGTSSRMAQIEGSLEEHDDDDSSLYESVEEVAQSPAFSEDGHENVFGANVGQSPVGSASRTSVSEDPFSGPFSGPMCNSVYDAGNFSSSPEIMRQNPLFEHCNHAVNGFQQAGTMDNCITRGEGYRHFDEEVSAFDNGSVVTNTGVPVSSKISKQNVRGDDLNPGKFLATFRHEGSQQIQAVGNSCISDAKLSGLSKKQMDSSSEIKPCDSLEAGKVKSDAIESMKGKSILQQTENAIRRETEGDFRLLGRRNGDKWMGGRMLSPIIQEAEEHEVAGERDSYTGMEFARDFSYGSFSDHAEAQIGDEDAWYASEPEVVCRSLDHADMLSLNNVTLRLRYLVTWLISSLLQLRHPGPEDNLPLVQIYGPQMRFDRGASVAFNLYDCHANMLQPELVQALADNNGISLTIGFLRNLQAPDTSDVKKKPHNWGEHWKVPQRLEVVTAALGIFSDFEDVYRMWVFVAKFLDADFVSKERGRPSTK